MCLIIKRQLHIYIISSSSGAKKIHGQHHDVTRKKKEANIQQFRWAGGPQGSKVQKQRQDDGTGKIIEKDEKWMKNKRKNNACAYYDLNITH